MAAEDTYVWSQLLLQQNKKPKGGSSSWGLYSCSLVPQGPKAHFVSLFPFLKCTFLKCNFFFLPHQEERKKLKVRPSFRKFSRSLTCYHLLLIHWPKLGHMASWKPIAGKQARRRGSQMESGAFMGQCLPFCYIIVQNVLVARCIPLCC